MNIWWLIIGLGLWSYALRVAGPLVLARTRIPPTAERVLNNITPAVLAALVVAGMFTSERELVLDERGFGFVAALVAVIAKAPPLVVIVGAAGATALARAFV